MDEEDFPDREENVSVEKGSEMIFVSNSGKNMKLLQDKTLH